MCLVPEKRDTHNNNNIQLYLCCVLYIIIITFFGHRRNPNTREKFNKPSESGALSMCLCVRARVDAKKQCETVPVTVQFAQRGR